MFIHVQMKHIISTYCLYSLKNIFSPEAAWPFQEVELRAPAGPSLSCFQKKGGIILC